jgi:putative acetyltransferase
VLDIRPEEPRDVETIDRITELAFGQRGEADVVRELRRQGAALVSLVAEADGGVVGHILFSPVQVHDDSFEGSAVGLAPMAVSPGRQRQGIGSRLVERGLDTCRERGYAAAVVLGHPQFYPRFGFRPALEHGLHCEYPVPPEVFMAMELEPGALSRVEGLVTYHPAFAEIG